MEVKLNRAGLSHADSLVDEGKVDKTSAWSMSADDENEILGPKGDDWAAYSAMHLGVDDAEPEQTKARYKYPHGKGGKVFRSALIAIRQRAGQQGATDIFDAAGELLDRIDGTETDEDTRPDQDDDGKSGAGFRFAPRLRAGAWAIMPERLDVVASHGAGARRQHRPLTVERILLEEPQGRVGRGGARVGAIAVLPLQGILTQGGYYDGGDCSTDQCCGVLAELLADDTIGAVVLDINSPGGSVYGTGEMGDMVFAGRKAKPIIGVANSLAASAAYWIGSQCTEFYCTPGGEVGSIGVYAAHADISGLLSSMGVKVSLISAGKYKTEGSPFEPLSDEARSAIQASVDSYYGQFTQAVSRGRGAPVASVRDGMGQGRVLGAKEALAAGMLDGIATRSEVLGGVAKRLRAAGSRAAKVEQPRRSALAAAKLALAMRR